MENQKNSSNKKIWHKKPASLWIEGLPIGTGRLAGMVFGSVKRERVGLNHEFLWKGQNRNRDTEKRAHLLPNVRELLLAGKYEEGTKAANEAFGGRIFRDGYQLDPYQPAGDLYFEINHGIIWNYKRELDLETGMVTVSYTTESGLITKQYLGHLTEDRLVIRIYREGKPFNCSIWMDRIFDPDCDLTFNASPDLFLLKGKIKNGMEFCAGAHISQKSGESFVSEDRKIIVTNTTEIIISINAGTDAYHKKCEDELDQKWITTTDWDKLLQSHLEEYKKHFGGFDLDLHLPEPDIPTNERIKNLRNGVSDPGIVLLFFNFGRYLLCASSANAKLPANLQGKWNEDLLSPWDSNYVHDMNLEMLHWFAEPAGMQKYVEGLLQYLERFVPHAKKAAMDLYGCRGIVLPLQTDLWSKATQENCYYGVWIGAAAWLSQHVWWHYEYSMDKEYLKNRAYPFMKEVAAFYEDYLVEDKNGVLQIVPSQSPENSFLKNLGAPTSCVSSAMDIELATDLLLHTIKSAEILGVDTDKQAQWKQMINKLPKLKIGSKGQLLEWNEEFTEFDPGHRHFSPLWGLFPGDQISEKTPELLNAALTLLNIRLASIREPIGWSTAWASCLFARTGDGNKAIEQLYHLIKNITSESLLDLCNPEIFQIDGNMGSTMAVIEMLFQSYHGEIDFLPALPAEWKEGKVTGMRGRGGYTLNFEWKESQLVKAELVSVTDRECTVKTRGKKLKVTDEKGNKVVVKDDGKYIVFPVKKNEKYLIQ